MAMFCSCCAASENVGGEPQTVRRAGSQRGGVGWNSISQRLADPTSSALEQWDMNGQDRTCAHFRIDSEPGILNSVGCW